MKAVDYTEVLKENLIPFLELFSEGPKVFQQDNAPIYTAKWTMNFLEESGMEVLEWPPQLPDLNPIEHLWEAVDRSLRLSRHQANGRRNLDHLFHCLQEAWQSIPDDILYKLLITPCQPEMKQLFGKRRSHSILTPSLHLPIILL